MGIESKKDTIVKFGKAIREFSLDPFSGSSLFAEIFEDNVDYRVLKNLSPEEEEVFRSSESISLTIARNLTPGCSDEKILGKISARREKNIKDLADKLKMDSADVKMLIYTFTEAVLAMKRGIDPGTKLFRGLELLYMLQEANSSDANLMAEVDASAATGNSFSIEFKSICGLIQIIADFQTEIGAGMNR